MTKKPKLPDVGEMTNELAGVLAFVRDALGLHQLMLPHLLNGNSTS